MRTTTIAFKDSARLKLGHLRPHMSHLLEALLATAPETEDGIMWVTEGYRPERHANDAHTWGNAWDIRSKNVIADDWDELEIIMTEWGAETNALLGDSPAYQFEAHGSGTGLHLHAEYDPR